MSAPQVLVEPGDGARPGILGRVNLEVGARVVEEGVIRAIVGLDLVGLACRFELLLEGRHPSVDAPRYPLSACGKTRL